MKRWWWIVAALVALFIWAKSGPLDPLFDTPKSTVLLDRSGSMLAASVASDGQWRMPPADSIPKRFEACLLEFEDRHFRDHGGIHVPSLVRAAQQNRRAGRVVSGGSTLTMQLARMAAGNRSRSIWNKLREMAFALRLELRFAKDELLAIYAANAPFGGNVVGLEAAAWRWYGRSPNTLSWAECATLAVLPNAPSRIHPGKGRDALKAKRDRLLDRLLATDRIDSMTWSLSKEETLPEAPYALPDKADHLLMTARFQGHGGKRVRSTVDGALQSRVLGIAELHAPTLQANEVHNAAIIVIDVPTGEVLAYMGNLPSADAAHAGSVDIVQARRSSGSLLKPFLYADMLQSGELMPDQLVVDLPTHYEGFAPRNYDERFDGAVPASQALARSLNVPAVRALHTHGIDRTLRTLRAMGLDHVDRNADDYGLSLIVGGAESTLWELTGAYASLARVASTGNAESGIHAPTYRMNEDTKDRASPLSAASIHHTLKALQTLNRPDMEAGWQQFSGTEAIAWKTGTSFGHRDAWAIGVTDRYAVGVWTGNADGEGRPGLTGTLAAAPILFEVFGILPDGHGFDPPYDALRKTPTCRSSGYRASADCTPVDTVWTIAEALRTPPCPYHVRILLDPTGNRQVRPGEPGTGTSWFVLPPQVEYYYSIQHPAYRTLPMLLGFGHENPLGMIYPENGARLFVPVELDGSYMQVVLHAAHRDPNATVHWDIDGAYIGSTEDDHRMAVDLSKGTHRLTLTDQHGAALHTGFNVERGRTVERVE